MGVWINAICSSLVGDDRELIEMLRYDNELDQYPDVREFLAWRLEKSRSLPKWLSKELRPKKQPLPAKFLQLRLMAKDPIAFDHWIDFEMKRGRWQSEHPDEDFPYKREINKLGGLRGRVNTLVRRSKKSRYSYK